MDAWLNNLINSIALMPLWAVNLGGLVLLAVVAVLADIFAKSYAGDSHDVQSLSPLYSSLLHLLPQRG